MFERVLIATDGTRLADDLVDCTAGLAPLGLKEALLLHVFDVRHVGGLSIQLEEELRPRMARQAEVLRRAGAAATVQTMLGLPSRDIGVIAETWNASAIVLGSTGGGPPAGFPLGSTAAALLHAAVRPVLLLPAERLEGFPGEASCGAWCKGFLDHVLHPTDFSDGAERAFLAVEDLVRHAGSRVTLLHVQDEVRLRPHLERRIEEFDRLDGERLQRMADRLVGLGSPGVRTEIVHGRPIPVLVGRCRKGDVKLAVAGCQGRGFVREIFLGGVASALARLAPIPVLFVPLAR